jgi:hypothetical protein
MHLATAARARQSLGGLAPLAAAVVLLAVVALLGGCATLRADVPAASPSPSRHGTIGAGAASSPAAELQAGLTARLVERTYLVAALGRRLAAAGGDPQAPTVDGPRQALDAASTALAEVIGATYSTASLPLQDALRRVDELLAQEADGRRLMAAYEELGAVVRRVVPVLDAAEVGARLAGEVQALTAEPVELRALAAEATETARLLAAGIAADRRLGEVGTPAGQLRADLTGLLTEHVLLAGRVGEEPDLRAALDANGLALGDLLGSSYPTLRAPFVRSWQAHVDRLERYGRARAGGGTGQAELGLVRGFPGELARLLAAHVDGLPLQTAEAELEPALELLVRAVAADPARPGLLREAAAGVLPVAALLSAAVAEDLRLA